MSSYRPRDGRYQPAHTQQRSGPASASSAAHAANGQPQQQPQQQQQPRPPKVDQYGHLPSFPAPGTRPRVIYTRNIVDVNTLAPYLAAGGVVGYDQEWRPNFFANQPENRVATIQVAGAHFVLVAQVSAMFAFPQALKELLESPEVMKLGVGLQSDAVKLNRDFGVCMANGLDIGALAVTIDISKWEYVPVPRPEPPAGTTVVASPAQSTSRPEPGLPRPNDNGTQNKRRERPPRPPRDPNAPKPVNAPGLARLVGHYLNLHLDKPKKIQRSNWELPLAADQVDYAANDAYCALVVYAALKRLAATTPRPAAVDPRAPEYVAFDLMRGAMVPTPVLLRRIDAWAPDPNLALDVGPVPEQVASFVVQETISSISAARGYVGGTGRHFAPMMGPPVSSNSQVSRGRDGGGGGRGRGDGGGRWRGDGSARGRGDGSGRGRGARGSGRGRGRGRGRGLERGV